MSFEEAALTFRCGADLLVGVLALPLRGAPRADLAVIVVVGGPQYRIGSHRQFTLLSRSLASSGYPALRFDGRGVGDSGGEARDFTARDDDIAAAIAVAKRELPQLRRIVLLGLCDGASAALLYLQRRGDDSVAGLCVLNPWVRTPTGLARTYVNHYYLRRIAQADFWRKLFAGAVSLGALSELVRHWRQARKTAAASPGSVASFTTLMASAWRAFTGPILLVLSGDDYTAREFVDHASTSPAWRGQLARRNVTRVDLAGANHTFANELDRERVADETLAWLARFAPVPTANDGIQALHGGTAT
jgi:exosortase A-associated hydrolase 1